MRGMNLSHEDLNKIRKWLASINGGESGSKRVSASIRCGILFNFEFRFLFKVKQDITRNTAERIFDSIETVSRETLFPNRYLDLRTGIIEISVQNGADIESVMNGLRFVYDQIPILIRE